MFNQFCSVIERHYPVTRIMEHLRHATPLNMGTEAVQGVYDDWDLDEVLDKFQMPLPTLALDSKRECFVIADYSEGQAGLYGPRMVLHCQSLDLSAESLPEEVQASAPTLPRDAVVVTLSKIFAVGRTRFGHRVNFSGDVGLSFTASKREGLICDPGAMRILEQQRLRQADPEDRWALFNFGREETIKAAVRAVECAIFASKRSFELQNPPKARPKSTKRKLALWEEREWLGA